MVLTRLVLVAACALAARCRVAEGVKACAECSGGATCIVEDTGSRLNAWETNLTLSMCNFDTSRTYALEFSLKVPLACDTTEALVPKAKSMAPVAGTCGADACPILVTLESPIDWAITMHSGTDVNGLLAKFTSGGSDESVTVATGQDIGSAAMQASATSPSISLCASDVPITGVRLSQLKTCNSAEVCRGAAGASACTVPLAQGLPVDNVTCVKDTGVCTGNVALSGALTCDASVGDQNTMIVAVKVGNSTLSNYQAIGLITAPKSMITDVSDLEAESSTFTLSTDSYCGASAIQVNLSNADGTVPATVSSVNSMNGSVAVTLSSSLEKSLDGKSLQFTLTQCGVASTAFTSVVGDDDSSSSDSGNGNSTNSATNAGNGYSTANKESTQETNASTGLSGGLIIGIAVGVVAACGFVFECWYHKRRQTPSQPSGNDAPVANGYGNHAI
uniref:Uncharacterized protein n=1 Tax=Globisporangium ultimum (strain ATCC 200006 / CBS 805.95 / DAOM BR144) TaxID=431595 RepID=K3X9W2_GLOUD